MRRFVLIPALLSMLVGFAPAPSTAGSCWPVPENSPACRPIPWPTGVPYVVQPPNGYDAQLLIVNGGYMPATSQPDQQPIDVRHGGNLFIHNLDTASHTVSIVTPGCQFPFTSCSRVREIGLYGLSAGPLAGKIVFDVNSFQKETIYPFFCRVHFDGTGNPLHWGQFYVRW